MPFDFEHAVSAPFRMQPGLRRIAPGSPQLTPLAPGSRHQREKLAVFSTFAPQALLQVPGFDAGPALGALSGLAALEHPRHWQVDGRRAVASQLGVAVRDDRVEQLAAGSFGLGDEIGRCLQGLPPGWRLAGLLSLAFAEDFAVVDAASGTIPWLAVALPSQWAPEEKLGRHFAQVHAPVADAQRVIAAGPHLMQLACNADTPERWERFVWTITSHPRLHAHPARLDDERWPAGRSDDEIAALACWRTERQTFIPVPGTGQAVFTIHVEIEPLPQAVASPERARRLHAALASMSPAVLAYRSLQPVQAPLLRWLEQRARA